MILSDLAVKRPTIAIVVNLLLVVFGIVAFNGVPLRLYPDIDPPVVSIQTIYPGASAAIVDTKVTRILEEQLSGIEDIRYIDSVSRDGASNITIEFDISRDIDSAVNDVQQSLGRTLDELPEEVDLPRVAKSDANAFPILFYHLVSDSMTPMEMSDYANRVIVDRLSIIDGVARVIIGGEQNYAMRIYLDRKAMAARGVTTTDIEDALRRENVELPAGVLESETRDLSVRVDPVYVTPDSFARLVVRRGDDGHLVRLEEVANVGVGAEDYETLSRRNGVSMISVGIVKQSQANTVDVARLSIDAADELRQSLPPGLEMALNYDSSIFIKEAIQQVYLTLAIAVVLVILVIYLFLNSGRATLIPAVTVPISLVAAFIFVYASGFSVNILTLLALVLAIGLVVDDTIVVLENIHRRLENGEPPLLAAYNGAREVGFAVVSTTLVLIAVFVPLVFLEGNIGRLFTEFALTMAAAVGFSSFVALTLSPVLCAKLLRQSGGGKSGETTERLLLRLEEGYEKILRRAGRATYSALGALAAAGALIALLLYLLPSEFAPNEDVGFLFVSLRGPEGSSYEKTRETMLDIEKVLLANGESWGMDNALLRAPGFGGGINTGIGIIGFKPWEERSLSTQEVMPLMYAAFRQVPDGRIFVFSPSRLAGSSMGQPVRVVIGADSYEQLGEMRRLLLDKLQDNPVLRNVDIDYVENAQQLAVEVDPERAADLGVSVASIGRTLETILGSRRVTTYLDRGEEYDVIVEGRESDFSSPDDLAEIYVRSGQSGKLVPLANLVSMEERGVSPSLPRYNRRRALTLSADIGPGYSLDVALEEVRRVVNEQLPVATSIDYKGESLEFVRAGGSITFVFVVAILVAYLVMAAQFESFLHPLVIMVTVPLAIVGALAGMFLTGQTINIFSQIGLVMLIGLAAKNGILIVEFANQLRDKGLAFEEALFQAARQRLRPILMTSVTTMLGALPLLLSSGAGSEVRFVLGAVIFFGVLSATVMTLFVLPSFYLAIGSRGNTPGQVARRIDRLNSEGG